jgi:hypothetical protein
MHWLNQNSAAVQAISTVVLVVVTIGYVAFTKGILNATRRRADLALVPELNGKRISATIVNVGQAPAVNPRLTVTYESDDPAWTLEITKTAGVIQEDDGLYFGYSFPKFYEEELRDKQRALPERERSWNDRDEQFLSRIRRITAVVTYRDPGSRRGRQIELQPIVDVADTANSLLRAQATTSTEADVVTALAKLVNKETQRMRRAYSR